jgi:hypothetical protein
MPASRRGRPAPEPEPEVTEAEEGPKDYSIYLDRPITGTMQGFADWLEQEVCEPAGTTLAKLPANKIVALAGTLRMEYQASDFNIERRAAEKAAREAARANGSAAAEDEPEPTPARTGRAARGRTATRQPAAASAPATKPATRTQRGRRGTAASEPVAPY